MVLFHPLTIKLLEVKGWMVGTIVGEQLTQEQESSEAQVSWWCYS